MSKPSVIVYGDKGCGKTRNAKKLQQALGLPYLQDDLVFGMQVPKLRDTLILTNEDVPARWQHLAMPFADAMARVKGGAA